MNKELVAQIKQSIDEDKFGANDLQELFKHLMLKNPEVLDDALSATDSSLSCVDKIISDLKEGRGDKSKLNFCVEMLSKRYSLILAQIGNVETRMEACADLKEQFEKKESMFRLGLFPAILLVEFVDAVKASIWTQVSWEQDAEQACENITDYARITEVWIEPNRVWDGLVRIVFRMKGYISESDFKKICVRINRASVYYV